MRKRATWDLRTMITFWLNMAVDYRNGDIKGLMYNLRFALKTGVPFTLKEHADMAEMIHENASKAIEHLRSELVRCNRALGVTPIEVSIRTQDPKIGQLQDAMERLVEAAQVIERAPRVRRGDRVSLPSDAVDGLLESLAAWRAL